MNDDRVIAQIYESTDYNKFKFMDGNRPTNTAHVDKVRDSIRKIGMKNIPILVDSNFVIYDGQHRFRALQRLGKPIPYVIDPSLSSDNCKDLNMCMVNWTIVDFIRSYASDKTFSNHSSYEYLVSLMDEFNIGSKTVAIATKGILNFSNKVKTGNLVVTVEEFNRAHLALEYAFDIYNEFPKDRRKELLLQTLIALYQIPDIDKNKLHDVVIEYSNQIRGYDSIEDCIRVINERYNKNLSSKRRNFIELWQNNRKNMSKMTN